MVDARKAATLVISEHGIATLKGLPNAAGRPELNWDSKYETFGAIRFRNPFRIGSVLSGLPRVVRWRAQSWAEGRKRRRFLVERVVDYSNISASILVPRKHRLGLR